MIESMMLLWAEDIHREGSKAGAPIEDDDGAGVAMLVVQEYIMCAGSKV